MTVVEVLQGARAKIVQGWCQDTAAKDAHGKGVMVADPEACSWCVLGAIWSCTAYGSDVELAAEDTFRRVLPGSYASIRLWNDRPKRTKEEVLRAFDRAIELVKEEEHQS